MWNAVQEEFHLSLQHLKVMVKLTFILLTVAEKLFAKIVILF